MSAHATPGDRGLGAGGPGAVLLCTGRYPRGIFDFVLSGRRSGEVVAHLGGGAETAHRNASHTGVPSFAGCIACSM
jgi:hypothetical protein